MTIPDEEDSQAPDRVRDGRPLDKVGEGHQDPLLKHGGLVLTGCLVEHGKEHSGEKDLKTSAKLDMLILPETTILQSR